MSKGSLRPIRTPKIENGPARVGLTRSLQPRWPTRRRSDKAATDAGSKINLDGTEGAGGTRVQKIEDWLASLGMLEYAHRFSENHIDFGVLRDLTDQDLKDLGVLSLVTAAK